MVSMSMFVYEGMRDRIERFTVLPFGFGSCTSHSSVAVGASTPTSQPCKPKPSPPPPPNGAKMKSTLHFMTLRKPRKSSRMQRLIRGIRSTFSQIFVYKEEEEEMEIKEMEIGFPTDVKHVTHIGLDGSTTTNNNTLKGSWENNNLNAPPDQILSFPSISLKQFELAMAAQTHTPHKPQLINVHPHQHYPLSA